MPFALVPDFPAKNQKRAFQSKRLRCATRRTEGKLSKREANTRFLQYFLDILSPNGLQKKSLLTVVSLSFKTLCKMYKSRIFGTPPEPVFNMKSACLPPELLEEALYVLADENEKSMDNASGIQGFFKGGKTAGNSKLKNCVLQN